MAAPSRTEDTASPRAFEPWMLSNVVTGAIMGAFVVLLIPPFVTEMTGSAARAGVVFAIMALSATTGPLFGRVADRYNAHRAVYTLSFAGMAVAFVILAIDSGLDTYSPIAGVLLGASMAAKGAVGSGMLVGSVLPVAVQARQLTVFNLLIFAGQIAGGALVAVLHLTSVGYRGQFWIAAGLIALGAVLTGITTGAPAGRLRATDDHSPAQRRRETALVAVAPETEPATAPVAVSTPGRPTLRATVASPFGALMIVIACGGFCTAVLSSQVANILPAVFGIGATATSTLVAAAGAVGIAAVVLAGAWMARSGPAPALSASVLVRAGGFLALAGAGLLAQSPLVAVAAGALYLLVSATNSLQRSPLPRVAALLSTAGPSEANGLVSASGAIGAFAGSLAAGFVADAASYEAVLWMSAAAAVLALPFLPAVLSTARSKGDRSRPGATPSA